MRILKRWQSTVSNSRRVERKGNVNAQIRRFLIKLSKAVLIDY